MKKQKKKWRGIPTNPNHRFENKPITIINRFNQKSLKLPRIDDKKRWAGYPGITGISRPLANLIRNIDYIIYLEPFAGTAKVFQELLKDPVSKNKSFVLNDKAQFIYQFLYDNFNDYAEITNMDFSNFIRTFDESKSLVIIDQPWFSGSYDQRFSYFDRKDIKQYDEEILSLCKGERLADGFNYDKYKIKGNFIITTRKENKRMLQSGFNNYLIQSEYVVCGKYPKVLLTTSLKFEGLEKP